MIIQIVFTVNGAIGVIVNKANHVMKTIKLDNDAFLPSFKNVPK